MNHGVVADIAARVRQRANGASRTLAIQFRRTHQPASPATSGPYLAAGAHRRQARIFEGSMGIHPDWYEDGIEDGEQLWRLDLPDIQIQLFVNVIGDEDAEPPVYGDKWRVVIEHDVRVTPGAFQRARYAFTAFKLDEPALGEVILSLPKERAARTFELSIAYVKKLPNRPEYCKE